MPFWSTRTSSSVSYKKTDISEEEEEEQQEQRRSIYDNTTTTTFSHNNNRSNSHSDQSIYYSHLLDKRRNSSSISISASSSEDSTSTAPPDPDGSSSSTFNNHQPTTPKFSSNLSSTSSRRRTNNNNNVRNQQQQNRNIGNNNSKMVLPKVKRSRSYLNCSVLEAMLVAFLLVIATTIIVMFGFVTTTTTTSTPNTTTTGGGGGGAGSALRVRQGSNTNNNAGGGNPAGDGETKYHVVFSTSCSYSHDWQSYLFYFHAMLHDQPGDVTRVVSGCSDEDEATMRKLHEEQFSIMNPNFLIHFTPEFGKQLNHLGFNYQQTKYWNKPFGLRHWLQHRFGYSWDPTGKDKSGLNTPHDDDIVILVDPDMLMQRPFINDFSKFPDTLWTNWHRKHTSPLATKVSPGQPIAQDYSFGSQWLTSVKHNLTYVVGPDSPVHQVTNEEAVNLYSAGPPYWFTARDGFLIAQHWAEFLPRLFEVKPVFMAEMYGYCMAAAHLGLKHQLARGFMVSNVDMYDGEGWPFLDNADGTTCDVSQFQNDVPFVIHFCQRYSVGEFFINKYLFPHEVLTCDHPMLQLPPLDIVSYTNYSYFGDGSLQVWEGRKSRHIYKHAFMICSLMPALNKAAEFYKDHHCPTGANRSKTYNHFRSAFYEKDHGVFYNKFHPEPFPPREE